MKRANRRQASSGRSSKTSSPRVRISFPAKLINSLCCRRKRSVGRSMPYCYASVALSDRHDPQFSPLAVMGRMGPCPGDGTLLWAGWPWFSQLDAGLGKSGRPRLPPKPRGRLLRRPRDKPQRSLPNRCHPNLLTRRSSEPTTSEIRSRSSPSLQPARCSLRRSASWSTTSRVGLSKCPREPVLASFGTTKATSSPTSTSSPRLATSR